MPSSTIATAVVITNANLAAQNAARHARKVRDCKEFLPTYKAEGATVREMQHYADCVNTVHPSGQMSPGVAALILISLLIGAAIGVWKSYKEEEGYIAFPLIGAFCGVLALLGVALIVWLICVALS